MTENLTPFSCGNFPTSRQSKNGPKFSDVVLVPPDISVYQGE